MPGRVICGALVVCLALLASAALAQDVTVQGNRFLRDGGRGGAGQMMHEYFLAK